MFIFLETMIHLLKSLLFAPPLSLWLSIQLFRISCWYSPLLHFKSLKSASLFLSTLSSAGDCRWGDVLIYIGNSLVQISWSLHKIWASDQVQHGKLHQHSHALLEYFWKLNPNRQSLFQVGYIRSSWQNRWFGGGDTAVQMLVPTITLK